MTPRARFTVRAFKTQKQPRGVKQRNGKSAVVAELRVVHSLPVGVAVSVACRRRCSYRDTHWRCGPTEVRCIVLLHWRPLHRRHALRAQRSHHVIKMAADTSQLLPYSSGRTPRALTLPLFPHKQCANDNQEDRCCGANHNCTPQSPCVRDSSKALQTRAGPLTFLSSGEPRGLCAALRHAG